MKSPILLLAFSVALISSCTTAYKTGQTPDDVYYSPARPEEEYVKVDKDEDDDRQYRSDEDYYDDRYLRMKVRNRNQWSDLDEWYYYGKSYSYGYGYNYYYSSWNPFISWNYNYNPYCKSCCVSSGYGNIKTVAYSKPRKFNLNSYNGGTPKSTTGKIFGTGTSNSNSGYSSPRNVRTSNEKSRTGDVLRDIFRSGNSRSSSNNSSTTTTNTNSSSSSSSSGSSGGSAPVRKF